MTGSWLRCLSHASDATRSHASDPTTRLVCFPHAGGSAAAFRLWPSGLPPRVELLAVQYPGRGGRMRETPVDRVPAMARHVDAALSELPGLPTVFFGHSMGGMVAFEVCRQRAARGRMPPRHLFVSSRLAPHLPASLPPLAHLPDADFLRALNERFAAVPAELLDHPDVLALLVPALRADVAALEHYQGACNPGAPAETLACPITAFGGTEDATATRAQLEAWRELTGGPFRLRMFPGGHFYLDAAREAVLAELSATLAAVAGTARELTAGTARGGIAAAPEHVA